MFDIKYIRDHPESFDSALSARGESPCSFKLLELDSKRRSHQHELQKIQERRNHVSQLIGDAKSKGDDSAAESAISEVSQLKSALQAGEEELKRLSQELSDALSILPNIALPDVPVGSDESCNRLHDEKGTKRNFDFSPKEHFDLGESLCQMDFQTAAKLSGSRFVVLHGYLARLERALGQFMLDLHTKDHGYLEVSPPLLVRDESVFGTGQLPKFKDDLFRTTDGKWLIPTAEVPLTNLVRDEILDFSLLPLRYTSLTSCFRSEAGAAGRDTRGMLRQHQFLKVELVSIVDSVSGESELDRMLSCAQKVLDLLELPYRTMVLCTGDMGFSACKTYDIEVWLPGAGMYREISSCSLCGDFQSRRMNSRYRGVSGVEFCHTLNGSGLALGRALIAVLENYQNSDGSITVPSILVPYMDGLEIIPCAS